MNRRVLTAAVLVASGLLGLLAAPAAFADTTRSSNWAGYAVHRSKVSFQKVIGSWTQPQPTCTAGSSSYSSTWAGIGGYDVSSPALEQIGTEADCSVDGKIVSTAWYELVPAPSRAIRLTIAPGDRVRAQVAITGHEVSLTLKDLTRRRSFTRRVHVRTLDTTSAEWIVEAPSLCSGGSQCRTLPLADFGSTPFTSATAESTTGHTGALADRHWTTTKIILSQGGHRFITTGASATAATATPSALARRGTAFTVSYAGAPSTAAAPAARVSAARLVHPAR